MLPIYVISLKTSDRRRQLCTRQMNRAGLSFSFFDAIDGAALSDAVKDRHYDRHANEEHFKRALSASEIGCYLSHLDLWEKVGAMGTGAALILEDDAELSAALKAFLAQIEGYDLSDVYLKLDGVAEAVDPDDADITEMTLGRRKVLQAARIAPRTTGYIIGAGAARQMAARRQRFFRPVDIDIKHYWEHGVPVWTVAPQLVRETPARANTSSIEASRQALKGANPLWRFWKNTTYQYNYLRQRKMHPPTASALLPHRS